MFNLKKLIYMKMNALNLIIKKCLIQEFNEK